jgi:hypothetical protein
MTNQQRLLARAIYIAIKEKAQNLDFVDRMVLMNALAHDHAFDIIPAKQQQMFLDVAMAAVKALQAQSKAAGHGS